MRPEFFAPDCPITDALLVDVLELVGVKPVRSLVADWTPMERLLAYDWAMREHLRVVGNLCRRRPQPSFVNTADLMWWNNQL